MIFVRGAAADFDDWRDAGNPGWGFDDVLPYFRKLETHADGASTWHGGAGPIHVTPMRDGTHPLSDAFLAACRDLGLPENSDFNRQTLEERVSTTSTHVTACDPHRAANTSGCPTPSKDTPAPRTRDRIPKMRGVRAIPTTLEAVAEQIAPATLPCARDVRAIDD